MNCKHVSADRPNSGTFHKYAHINAMKNSLWNHHEQSTETGMNNPEASGMLMVASLSLKGKIFG